VPPARNHGLLGASLELAAFHRMTRRIGMTAEPYHHGRSGAYLKAGEVLAVLGAAGSLAGSRRRFLGRLSGGALLAASAATRWGIFHARMASARDPKYTVIPQRRRLERQARTHGSFDECLIRLSNANVVSSESGRVPSGGGVVVMVLSYRPCCA
jgi:hypothetical protein